MKNNKFFWVLLALIFSSQTLMGQFNFKKSPKTVSYYSNMIVNPGISFGTQYILKEKTAKASDKVTRNRIANLKRKTWLIHGQAGAYAHLYNHTVVFTNYEIRYQKTTKRGRKYFAGLGIHVERSFLPETYTVNADGNVDKIFLPGHFYMGPILSMGNHFKRKFFSAQNELFIEIQIPLLIDYNNALLPKINFAVGMLINSKENQDYEKSN